MALDGKILHRAKTRLDENRHKNETEHARRLAVAYRKNPKIRQLDMEIKATVIDAVGFALSSGKDPEEAIDQLREENLYLQSELSQELLASGLPANYIDEKYMCEKCHDTGYCGTKICSCLMALYNEEQKKELSATLKLGEETFDNFNLEYYDDAPDPATGISPRANMDIVYETCIRYAEKFGKSSYNLFFHGGTGLGKTFLSSCIAKVVSERGYSVVYDTAQSVFSKFEEDKFSKSDDISETRNDIHRYMTCDLLIMDDLGTELTTSFVVSALYNLINTRLVSGKKTIISSNFSIDELKERYSPQIMSRLEGEYQSLPFYGRDIRLIKKDLL